MLRLMLVLMLAFTGCSVGPNYEPKELEFESELPVSSAILKTKGDDELFVPTWQKIFDNADVNSLLAGLESGNLDLRRLQHRVNEARYLAKISRSEILPSITADASYERARKNAFASGFGEGQQETELYSAGFDALWEIDIFGGRRRAISVNKSLRLQSERLLDQALVTLQGELLSALVDYSISNAELLALEETLSRQRAVLKLLRARVESGSATAVDTSRSEALLYEAKALTAPSKIKIAEAFHRINILLGEEPRGERLELPGSLEIEPFLIVGTVEQIVANRPDVKSAEFALAAETYRIGVQQADLYPRLIFNGSVALEAPAGDFAQKKESWSFGPSLRWAFLDSFRQAKEVYAQEEKMKQFLANFQQTLLLAFEEISNAVISFENRGIALESLEKAAGAQKQAADLVRKRYDVGFSNFLDVLEAERELLNINLSMLEGKRQYLLAAIALRKSLGLAYDETKQDEKAPK